MLAESGLMNFSNCKSELLKWKKKKKKNLKFVIHSFFWGGEEPNSICSIV